MRRDRERRARAGMQSSDRAPSVSEALIDFVSQRSRRALFFSITWGFIQASRRGCGGRGSASRAPACIRPDRAPNVSVALSDFVSPRSRRAQLLFFFFQSLFHTRALGTEGCTTSFRDGGRRARWRAFTFIGPVQLLTVLIGAGGQRSGQSQSTMQEPCQRTIQGRCESSVRETSSCRS